MNPDDDDAVINQLKHPRLALEVLPKVGIDFVRALENRKLRQDGKQNVDLQAFAEDELVRKEYKELRCEMPGTPRSTFLMVFSPDGTKVASTHGNHNIYVTDLRSGRNIRTLVGHPRTPWCIAFHPTCNELVASGCLGGQVRIWDLSGGSEVWTAGSQTVIASIAFHPSDRILVIATYNELYFWDWSKPQPFTQTATCNTKEKVRYVAFDKLGHKLITGIANTPQSRWERSRANTQQNRAERTRVSVSVPVSDRSVSPYRRRTAPRIVGTYCSYTPQPSTSNTSSDRVPLSSVPERERRITACYRNLVHEYELLVHRYLQVYRPPTTIDRGTDPMEMEQQVSDAQTPGPSTSNYQRASSSHTPTADSAEAGPSTSSNQPYNIVTNPSPSIDAVEPNVRPISRFLMLGKGISRTETASTSTPSTSRSHLDQVPSETSPRRRLVMRTTLGIQTSTDSPTEPSTSSSKTSDKSGFKMRIKCSPRRRTISSNNTPENFSDSNLKSLKEKLTQMQKNLTQSCNNQINDMAPKIAEFKNSQSGAGGPSLTSTDAPSTSTQAAQSASSTQERQNDNNRESWRLQLKRLYPGFLKKATKQARKPILDTSSDNSSSEDEDVIKKRLYCPCPYPHTSTPSASARSNESAASNASQSPFNQGMLGSDLSATSSSTSWNTQAGTSILGNSNTRSTSESVCNRTGTVCQASNRRSNSDLDQLVSLTDIVANARCDSAEQTSNADSICDRCGGNIESRAESSTSTSNAPLPSDATRLTAEVEALVALADPSRSSRDILSADDEPSIAIPSPIRRRNLSATEDEFLANMATRRTTPVTETRTSSLSSVSSTSPEDSPNIRGCARTDAHVSQPCARTLMNTDTRTTNSTVYTPSSGPRRRFFSHVLSAFLPTRVHNVVPQMRPRRSHSFLSSTRNPLDSLNRASGRLTINFAPDEVINYSERVNAEDDLTEQSSNLNEFHPFDPPPEFPSINPENIGIGNMYSNIVQDLESSLNNVRNIRASNRPGETSDMLSSFSERLESIMHQSDSILRNLRHTMDMLPPNSEPNEPRRLQRTSPALQLPSPRAVEVDHPRFGFLFNDPNFYVRDQTQNNATDRNSNGNRSDLLESLSPATQHEELYSNRSAIASDHTYPRNPESPRTLPPASDNLTPLMTSLHLTISHIQRQARLLRRQVESIERIDRAMLEVAQLQTIRQMFVEIRRNLSNLSGSDNRSTGVSSVRQMMAGTRISDSSPCDSPAEDETSQNRLNAEQSNTSGFGDSSAAASSSSVDPLSNPTNSQIPRQRVTARKSFPPSRLLHIQRQNRRFSVVNLIPRRYTPRDRLTRRRVYFRTFSVRPNSVRLNSDVVRFPQESGRVFSNVTHVNSESLVVMTRRLEQLLTEHIRLIGRPAELHPRDSNAAGNDGRENAIIERLNVCRARLSRLAGHTITTNINHHPRIEISSVTNDGVSRFNARDTLSAILDILSRFFDENSSTSISQSLRSQIRNVIDLTSLLSDILLLHIVDSIPPPTGMNLDPERESLSARIDQMCSRMLQSRLSGQSHSLTRSLRLMRLTARYASRALGQTYNARRNAIFSSGNNSRRELIGQINSTLHSIHRNRGMSYTPIEVPPSTNDSVNSEMPMREWYRTINALVSRYSSVSNLSNPSSSSSNSTSTGRNTRFGERSRRNASIYDDLTTNSDDNDDNEPDWYNNNLPSDRRQLLYRTNNVNLLNNESVPYTTQNRSWNVPTVQINDVPISESNSAWHSRITQHRYRLSDLRTNTSGNLFRPRFLHPLYAGVNPFDADLDDPQREQMYDGDMILTVTPNHRIQAWDISSGNIPDISNSMKNIVVGECKIHNDASVDISADGTILVTLLPSGGYLNVTNRLGVYSLRWETLGQCLYITSFEQNAVSVSLSPLSRHLVVGLASRRVSIVPNDKWTMARIFLLNQNEMPYGSRLPVLRELEQNRDTNYMSLNCIRWLPVSGQGLIYATNTGQLRILT